MLLRRGVTSAPWRTALLLPVWRRCRSTAACRRSSRSRCRRPSLRGSAALLGCTGTSPYSWSTSASCSSPTSTATSLSRSWRPSSRTRAGHLSNGFVNSSKPGPPLVAVSMQRQRQTRTRPRPESSQGWQARRARAAQLGQLAVPGPGRLPAPHGAAVVPAGSAAPTSSAVPCGTCGGRRGTSDPGGHKPSWCRACRRRPGRAPAAPAHGRGWAPLALSPTHTATAAPMSAALSPTRTRTAMTPSSCH
mmetsp:Transcript_116527/g.376234  ORF Transcript_116527/g.376234 Transcript_116527/m.376234 type:complete len:248 (+) Transcript_116527:40-783(+)